MHGGTISYDYTTEASISIDTIKLNSVTFSRYLIFKTYINDYDKMINDTRSNESCTHKHAHTRTHTYTHTHIYMCMYRHIHIILYYSLNYQLITSQIRSR
jgi:hypothetical protein